ncbi:transposase, partial [Faecalibaculum rodentium]|uniref:transposase n=1 Tax=Faecalibaculum rodentium TaxID=1702221 RepID=UPI001F5941F4
FTNKRHNKLKLLHYDGTGFWLLHKQLSKGTFKWRMSSPDPFLQISPLSSVKVIVFQVSFFV